MSYGFNQHQQLLEQARNLAIKRLDAAVKINRDCWLDPVNQERVQQSIHILHQVDLAQIRIEQGTFGVCQHCGEPIPMDRLEAIPYVATCASCQQIAERRGKA